MDTGSVVVATPVSQREAKPASVKSEAPSTLTPEKSAEMPLEIYMQEKKSPYINELLEVDDVLPEYMKESIGKIDDYINAVVYDKGLKPTTDVYKRVYERVKQDLGIDSDATLETTVERVSKYVEAVKILRSLKNVDEARIIRLLKKAPTNDIINLVMRQIEKSGL